MAWQIRQDFHVDVGGSFGTVLMVSGDNSALRHPAPDVVSGDKMPVRFYFWSRGAADVLEAADPGSGAALRFSGRPATVPPGTDLLFFADTFTEVSPGVWEGEVDLNTTELLAHLEASPVGAKTIVAEIEVSDDSGGRKSLQFPMVVRPEVYEGQDTPVSLPAPTAWLDARLSERGVRPVRNDIAPAGAIAASGTLLPYELSVDGDILGDNGLPIDLAILKLGNVVGDLVSGFGEWTVTLPDTGTLDLYYDPGFWVMEYTGPAAASPIQLTAPYVSKDPLAHTFSDGTSTVTVVDVAGRLPLMRGDLGRVTGAAQWWVWDGECWENVVMDGLRQRVATLAADHVVNSSVASLNPTPLKVDLKSGRTYRVKIQIVVASTVTAGIRAGFSGPAGKYRLMRWRDTVLQRIGVAANSHELALSEAENKYWYEGIVSPSANGDLAVTLSQETSSVDDTTLLTYSRIEVEDITERYSEI